MNGKEFLGRGLKFPLQVDPRTGKFAMVDQEEDIREAIGIILNTMQGERIMRPYFGTNVVDYIFASATSTMMNSIAHDVREQLAAARAAHHRRTGFLPRNEPFDRCHRGGNQLYGAQHQQPV